MTLKIPTDKMTSYRVAARRRQEQKARQLSGRRQRAWDVARRAGQLLQAKFGASRVVVFGSLLVPRRFHQHSDVDLAVWGLDEHLYYRAVACLLDLDPAVSVDLIEAELASPALLTVIEREGVAL